MARALTWLGCQQHQRLYLLQQNGAGDWADIMPRAGFVLYTSALWYHVKRRFGLPHRQDTRYFSNHLFFPFSDHVSDQRRARLPMHSVRHKAKNRALYPSFVNFSCWGEDGDVFGNLLTIVLGVARHAPASQSVHALVRAGVHESAPVAGGDSSEYEGRLSMARLKGPPPPEPGAPESQRRRSGRSSAASGGSPWRAWASGAGRDRSWPSSRARTGSTIGRSTSGSMARRWPRRRGGAVLECRDVRAGQPRPEWAGVLRPSAGAVLGAAPQSASSGVRALMLSA